MEWILDKWSSLILPWLITHGIKIVIIFVGAYFLHKIVYKLIDKAVRIAVIPDNYTSPEAEKKREDTLIRIFSAAMKIVILTLAALMILDEIGIEIGPILAGAGIVGLAFGFGGQYLIRDIISGFFIILENQYRIGDVVKFDSVSGLVEDIGLRMTTLRDMDGVVHHVPHGEIHTVSNMSKTFSRVNLNVGVSYGSNLQHVIDVVNRVGKELAEDAYFKEFIISPPQFLRVDNFGDSSVDIKILGDTKPLKQWEITGELRKRLFIAFNNEGIEIPFPQRTVHFANSPEK